MDASNLSDSPELPTIAGPSTSGPKPARRPTLLPAFEPFSSSPPARPAKAARPAYSDDASSAHGRSWPRCQTHRRLRRRASVPSSPNASPGLLRPPASSVLRPLPLASTSRIGRRLLPAGWTPLADRQEQQLLPLPGAAQHLRQGVHVIASRTPQPNPDQRVRPESRGPVPGLERLQRALPRPRAGPEPRRQLCFDRPGRRHNARRARHARHPAVARGRPTCSFGVAGERPRGRAGSSLADAWWQGQSRGTPGPAAVEPTRRSGLAASLGTASEPAAG